MCYEVDKHLEILILITWSIVAILRKKTDAFIATIL